MTVRELGQKLFDIENQDAKIYIMTDSKDVLTIDDITIDNTVNHVYVEAEESQDNQSY